MIQSACNEWAPVPQDLRLLLLAKLTERSLPVLTTEAIVFEAVGEHLISGGRGATLFGFEGHDSRAAFFERRELFNECTAEVIAEDFKTIYHHLGKSTA